MASHRAVPVPNRALRLFPALLAEMGKALLTSYGDFLNSFTMKVRAGLQGGYHNKS